MLRIDKESLMDWFNTKQGRKISPPGFGDKLTVKDIIPPRQKIVYQKVRVVKVKHESFIESLKRRGFTTTHIKLVCGRVKKIKYLVDLEQTRTKKGIEYVQYADKNGKNVSKKYAVSQ